MTARAAPSNVLLVAGANWRNARMLPVANVAASWEVGRGSALSCVVPAEDAYRLGFGPDLRGLWVRWTSAWGATWGGIVWDAPAEDGAIELAARTFHALLEGRVVEPGLTLPPSTPGGLARQLVWRTRSALPIPFVSYAVDQSGPISDLETRGESVESLLERLGDDHGQWHDVTVSGTGDLGFVWRQGGRDLTGSVVLAEGYHAIKVRLEPTMQGVANDVTVVGAESEFRRAAKLQVWDADSRAARGAWQRVLDAPTVKALSTLRARGLRELRRWADPPTVATVTLPDSSPWLRRFSRGDAVRLRSRSANREAAFTVAVVACDTTAGTVDLTGTVEAIA